MEEGPSLSTEIWTFVLFSNILASHHSPRMFYISPIILSQVSECGILGINVLTPTMLLDSLFPKSRSLWFAHEQHYSEGLCGMSCVSGLPRTDLTFERAERSEGIASDGTQGKARNSVF